LPEFINFQVTELEKRETTVSKQLPPDLQSSPTDALALCNRLKRVFTTLTMGLLQFKLSRHYLYCSIVLLGATLAGPSHGQSPGYIGTLPYRPGNDVNLFYDNQTGTVSVFSTPNLSGMTPYVTSGWGTTWTHIIPGNFGGGAGSFSDFLFYDKNSGIAEFYSCHYNGSSLSWIPLKRYTNWSPGHTIIVPGNFGGTSVTGQTDLLIYDGATGSAGFYDVWGQGNINLMKGYSNWSPGHTIIVPGNFGGTSVTGQTDLLIYDGATGGAGFFDVWGQGNINLMKSYTDWSPGHSIIVPGNFGGIGLTDLLIYDGASGGAGFFDVWGQGNINLMKGYTDWSPNHSFIVPGDFGTTLESGQTDLFIYDDAADKNGFFDVWGQGNLNATGVSIPIHHWSLITSSFQVVPQITSFSPSWGAVGTPVTIKGKNLNGADRVQVGVASYYPGDNVSFSVNSSTTVTAIMSPNDTGYLAVTTPAGRDESSSSFVGYSPPVKVTVPNVVGTYLTAAEQTLQQNGLQVGTVSGASGSILVVASQSPIASASVNLGTKVNLVVRAVQNGYRSVILTNYIPTGDSVYVWLFDEANGSWTLENGGNLLPYGAALNVSLTAQAIYDVYAVDPNLCYYPDPTDSTCVPWQWKFAGNPQGSSVGEPMN
jgi:hypothetical protein